MDVLPLVCTVAVVAATVALIDGRAYQAERKNDYVGEGLSIWPAIRASKGKNGWFVRYLRCSRSTFFAIADQITKSWTTLHRPLHGSSHFDIVDLTAVALYYLTHCDGLECAALVFGIGKTKAYEYIMEILLLLQHTHLKSTVTLPSTMLSWLSIAVGFESIAGFPNVYGAIDGCLIMIKRFHQHEGWYCRKGFPAFNLLAVVDDKKRFMAYSLRPGSQNDRMLFKNSIFGSCRIIPHGGFLLADAGFTLLPHVLTPYQIVPGMDDGNAHYNLVHSRTRNVVEQSFGLWKNKFRLFKKPLEFQTPHTMALAIEATLVLHNWIIDLEPCESQPSEQEWMHLGGDTVLASEKYTSDSEKAKTTREIVKQYLRECNILTH